LIADREHRASGFVAGHEGEFNRVFSFDEVEVTVAHAGSRSPDKHLAMSRGGDLQVLDQERLVDLA
jgi:hypothetical protein